MNSNDPELDGILKQALKARYVKQFDGYQEAPAGVVRQVAAIWLVLETRGIRYSNIAGASGVSNKPEPGKIYYQRVRTVDQSLHSAQANCVDGTVLFASALEHIGIDCELVHPNGHMFLLFYAGKGRKVPICLETTMLGAHAPVNPHLPNPIAHFFPWYDFRDRPFEAAVQYGDYELVNDAKTAAGIKNKTASLWELSLISIAKARTAGILPLPAPSDTDNGK